MIKLSIVEAIKEATANEDLAFRVFEAIRPRKAWELEALDDELVNILKEGV